MIQYKNDFRDFPSSEGKKHPVPKAFGTPLYKRGRNTPSRKPSGHPSMRGEFKKKR